jgi:hypothetical protein
VWTWGCDDDHALGRGDPEEGETFVPGVVKGLRDVVCTQVVCGASHTGIANAHSFNDL